MISLLMLDFPDPLGPDRMRAIPSLWILSIYKKLRFKTGEQRIAEDVVCKSGNPAGLKQKW